MKLKQLVQSDLGLLILSRAIQAGFGLVLLRFMTTVLDEVELARYFFVIAVANGLALVLVNPLNLFVSREVRGWRKSFSWTSVAGRIYLAFILLTLLGFALWMPLALRPELFSRARILDVAFGIVSSFLGQFLFYNLTTIQNVVGPSRRYSCLMLLGQSTIFLITLLIWFMDTRTASTWFAVTAIGYSLANLLFVFTIRLESWGQATFRFVENLKPTLLKTFFLPVIFVTLAAWVQNQGYRFVISLSGTAHSIASLSIGLGITASLGAVLESLIQQYYYPIILRSYEVENASSAKELRRIFFEVMAFLVLSCTGLFCFADAIVRLLTDANYWDASRYIRWGALIEFFRTTTAFLYMNAIARARVNKIAKQFLIGSALTLIVYLGAFVWPSFPTDLAIVVGILLGIVTTLLLLLPGFASVSGSGSRSGLLFLGRAVLLALPLAAGLFIDTTVPLKQSVGSLILAGFYMISVIGFYQSSRSARS